MITTDFHTHTNISVDSSSSLDEMIVNAIKKGYTEIAITDHVDHNPADDGAGLYDPIKAYQATVDAQKKYAGQISIRLGAELSEPHLYTRENQVIYQLPQDVIIGSVHCIGPYGIHLNYFDAKQPDEAIREYFQFMLEMVRVGDFDILGHLDYFERYSFKRGLPNYNPEDYKVLITEILSTIIERNIALEVNTSCFRSNMNRPFPRYDVLEWYYKMGGRLISIGSDAHCPDHLGTKFDAIPGLLRQIGFQEYHVYRTRKPVPLALE